MMQNKLIPSRKYCWEVWGVGNLMVLSSKDFQRGEFYLHINKGLYQLIFTFPPWLASDHNPSGMVWQGRPGDSHRFSEMMDTRLRHSAVRLRGGRSRALSVYSGVMWNVKVPVLYNKMNEMIILTLLLISLELFSSTRTAKGLRELVYLIF